MTYKIDISKQAQADLRGIYEYIAYNLLSPQSAERQLERLEEQIIGLNKMPMRFREYEREPWHSRGMRIMPVGNFVVMYIPNEEKCVVTIIRVMYGGRDIDTEMKSN
ncbi:MAG: type II toxin-antitoxin system RelE/ParE family toxin [Oscillospiraceae bacterium]|nr:type II toxin-antitoxin system RelE/ParE family toxin [Oscillospiraceae bacterium]